jgi:hypothetical protein
MAQTDFVEDPVLTGTASYTFGRGKYNGNILRYLADYYRGMTKNMRDIWKAASSFEVDCYRLSENILGQMLFSGSYVGEIMEIFRNYLSQGGDHKMKEAFLTQCSYDYFILEKMMDDFLFEEIFRMQRQGEPLIQVCRLAFLKHYAENPAKIHADIKPVLRQYLGEMVREGIHLNFFKEIKDCEDILRPMADKTIVEYRKHPDAQAKIYYTIMYEDGGDIFHSECAYHGGDSPYGDAYHGGDSLHGKETLYEEKLNEDLGTFLAEDMIPIYGGMCFKEFILFFGETLQYYIVEIRDGDEQLTASGNLQKGDTLGKGNGSKYEMINDIVISKILEDYDTLDYLLEEYYRKEYLSERLFHIREGR